MILDIFEEIKNGNNVRQNLSKLRQELKEGNNKHALLFNIGASGLDIFLSLLDNEDAKTRKNVVLVMGQLGRTEFLQPIFEAYKKESQLFVKTSYLQAMREFDYRKYLPELKNRLDELTHMEIPEESKKHLQEEIRVLSEMILTMEGTKHHIFTGFRETSNVILLTNRDNMGVTLEHLKSMRTKVFNAGIMVQTTDIEEILEIRTFQELLFVVPGMSTLSSNVEQASEMIKKSELLKFLKKRHDGTFPFYFRLECKSKMPLDKKSTFTKKLSAAIEQVTNRQLINSTSNYEVEIRLIENKEGSFNVLLKLYTLKDNRFSYRKEVIAASIRPMNAALTVALTKKYMKEDAQVIDPFCGVGTMLIERHKAVKANTMYGIDIYNEAIEKARVNTEAARQIIHYVNRDFFEFKHEYLFDEIITDMPFVTGRTSSDDIYQIYESFFSKIKEHLKEDAVMILYSHNRDFVHRLAPRNKFEMVEEMQINRREGTFVFVLKQKINR